MDPNQQNMNANQSGLPVLRNVITPQFLTAPIGIPTTQVYNPAPVAINTSDPAYIQQANEQYNQQLADYQRSEQLARQEAQQGQNALARGYNVTANLANQQLLANENTARQNYQDTLLQNRNRARALGAGSSSGYLDLASRADRTLSGDIMGARTRADQVTSAAALSAQDALEKLTSELNRQIAAIESDRRLSIRQKDAAIANARIQAAQSAASGVDWGSFLNGLSQDQGQQQLQDQGPTAAQIGALGAGVGAAISGYSNPTSQPSTNNDVASIVNGVSNIVSPYAKRIRQPNQ